MLNETAFLLNVSIRCPINHAIQLCSVSHCSQGTVQGILNDANSTLMQLNGPIGSQLVINVS